MLLLGMPDFLRSILQLRMSSLLLLLRSFALSELSLGAPTPAPAVHPLAEQGLLQHLLSLIVYAQQDLRLGPSCMLHLLRSFALRSLLARSSLAPGSVEPPPFA